MLEDFAVNRITCSGLCELLFFWKVLYFKASEENNEPRVVCAPFCVDYSSKRLPRYVVCVRYTVKEVPAVNLHSQ